MRSNILAFAVAAWAATGAVGSVPVRAATDAPAYTYDTYAPLDLSIETTTEIGAVRISSISYRSLGQVVHATLVQPKGESPSMPGVLFVRDIGADAAGDTATFFEDAKWLARRGAVSLIPDLPYMLDGWLGRVHGYENDGRDAVANVVALRRSFDMLGATGGVDKARLALVAQGIGGTYGALMTGVDSRPLAAMFLAPDLSLAKRLERGAKAPPPSTYEGGLAAFDTRSALGRSAFRASFLQFGKHDALVPRADADAFVEAIPGNNKSTEFYDADHTLVNDLATDERRKWLVEHLFSR